MAQSSILSVGELDSGWILAPERYDPRRKVDSSVSHTIKSVATAVRDLVDAKSADKNAKYLILDTGDAQEGTIQVRKALTTGDGIGSSKKRARPDDVIISRLRPYLRQVALVDAALCDSLFGPTEVLCSTEFFVLRSRDSSSIAFLVPFLLSKAVQETLAASQEGGHHPRFTQQALESIGIPEDVLSKRDELSREVIAAVTHARTSGILFRDLITRCDIDASQE